MLGLNLAEGLERDAPVRAQPFVPGNGCKAQAVTE